MLIEFTESFFYSIVIRLFQVNFSSVFKKVMQGIFVTLIFRATREKRKL